MPWTRLPGQARDLAITATAEAYAVDLAGTAQRWRPAAQRWSTMSGSFVRITGAESNRPWAVTPEGVAMRHNGLWWEPKAENVADVAGDAVGNVYIARRDGGVRRWEPLSGNWKIVPGAARRIALDAAGRPWIVAPNGRILRRAGDTWRAMPGRARDIAIGSDGTAVIVDDEGHVRIWRDEARRWVRIAGVANVVAVAVTPNGGPWAAGADGAILASVLIRSDDVAVEERQRAFQPQAPQPQPRVSKAPGIVVPEIATSTPTPSQPTAQSGQAPQATATTPSAGGVAAATGDGAGQGGTPSVSAGNGGGTTDPATITTDQSIEFTDTRETAERLAIGADGSVFALAAGGVIERWNNALRRFESFPGQLTRIAVAPNGSPWGVTSLGRVFRHDGQRWRQIVGATASDIGIGADGTVITADADSNLARFNPASGRFEHIDGRGLQVAVAPDGTPWTIRDDGFVQRCDVSPCTSFPRQARDIALGPDGSVFLVSTDEQLLRRTPDEDGFSRVLVAGYTPADVAVGPRGLPWVVATDGTVLAAAFFERDEGADRAVALGTQSDTTGSGATAPVVSTQSTSAFTFTKNMEFEYYNSGYAVLDSVHAGHTGAVFIDGDTGVMRFDEKTETFEELDTDFPGDVVDVDEDADGVLWGLSIGIANEDARVYRIKGSQVKTFSIANTEGDTPRNMVVDGDGTVYAAVGARLYRKTASSNAFQRYTTSNDVLYVAVGLPGDIWIVNQDSVVQQYTGSRFENRPHGQSVEATDIGAGPDGSIYIVDNSSNLPKKWNATNKRFDEINTSQQMNQVDVTDEGRPWFAITSFFSANGDVLRAKD